MQPLNAARLYASSLVERSARDFDPHEQYGEIVRNLDGSLESVEEILTALLDISRLDAGAMKPEFSVFRIQELFDQLRIEFEPLARANGLKLTFAPCSLSVRSDRRLLRRLLQNLISNAVKYTPRGRVLVGCRRQKNSLSLAVLDTGLGIPESKQKEVFREFERLAPAMRTARGLGLGLSIVERIGKVLDHCIWLKSQPGRGSMFRVEIPIAEPAKWPAAGNSGQAATFMFPLSGMNILAIDNEPRILEGMKTLLGGWGCMVITAADRASACDAVEKAGIAPQGLIADYHLDKGDGIAAIIALRGIYGDDLPSVLITADRSHEVRDHAAAHNIRVLNKPLRPAALRALLSQWRITQRAAE